MSPPGGTDARPRLGLLFNFDWDADGCEAHSESYRFDHAGFDLFSFPSNLRLAGFDILRFARAQARRGQRRGWAGVVSHHEQFGALAAALVAEQLGLPGATPEAIVAAQHKLHARRVLQRVAPQACPPFALLEAEYGADVPARLPPGLQWPVFVKPVKAAFSVLAREVANRAQLQAHTRFGAWERWIITRLVEPFDRVCRQRLPEAGSAHRLLLEAPVHAAQFNLDGWMFEGRAHALGVVDAVMYPGTQAFMRWEHPSRLAAQVQARALEVAQRFLSAIGFGLGLFNMEFFFDAATDQLTVIEFNPRLASQFGDLYRRVSGRDPHAMALALALGRDPAALPRSAPSAAVAASLVYRSFPGEPAPATPTPTQLAAFAAAFPDGLVLPMPKDAAGRARDFKWLGSHRHGIVHLGGRDAAELAARSARASALLGWRSPYAQHGAEAAATADAALARPAAAGGLDAAPGAPATRPAA